MTRAGLWSQVIMQARALVAQAAAGEFVRGGPAARAQDICSSWISHFPEDFPKTMGKCVPLPRPRTQPTRARPVRPEIRPTASVNLRVCAGAGGAVTRRVGAGGSGSG